MIQSDPILSEQLAVLLESKPLQEPDWDLVKSCGRPHAEWRSPGGFWVAVYSYRDGDHAEWRPIDFTLDMLQEKVEPELMRRKRWHNYQERLDTPWGSVEHVKRLIRLTAKQKCLAAVKALEGKT